MSFVDLLDNYRFLKLEANSQQRDRADQITDLKTAINGLIKHVLFWVPIQTWDEKEVALQSTLEQIDQIFQEFEGQLNVIKQQKIEQEFQKQMTSTKRLSHKRGPYKRYSSSVKEDALKLISEGHSVRNVCLRMGIPKKNLKRWIDMGSERKKGGGRKRMDEQMEHDLYKWCIEEGVKLGRPVSRKMIRQKALELSKFPNKFKASKGWTDKFVKKFNLRKKVIKYYEENYDEDEKEMAKWEDESEYENDRIFLDDISL